MSYNVDVITQLAIPQFLCPCLICISNLYSLQWLFLSMYTWLYGSVKKMDFIHNNSTDNLKAKQFHWTFTWKMKFAWFVLYNFNSVCFMLSSHKLHLAPFFSFTFGMTDKSDMRDQAWFLLALIKHDER